MPRPKRIIACCDGTWENGVTEANRSGYTNILRISRAVEHFDVRTQPEPISQIVYYGSGVGSATGLASYAEGITGEGLSTKVEEAYSFISTNYEVGDEVFLFGFSRGAYTARMVAGLIGEFGLLNKRDMEKFPELFLALQKEGASRPSDTEIKAKTGALLAPWRALAKQQIEAAGGWLIKAVGVFDTVGSVGLPVEIHKVRPKVASLFGFSNTDIGPHIQHGFHALALNETRKDFTPTKWTQTEVGRAKGQTLKQVWFSGEHSDIGGGWDAHDLADITLAWMISQTAEMIAFSPEYIMAIPNPVAPYGQQRPHNPLTGIFKIAESGPRTPPTVTDEITHETIHFSVTCQTALTAPDSAAIAASPSLVHPLEGFEQQFHDSWTHVEKPEGPGRQPQTLPAMMREDEHPHPKDAVNEGLKTAENMAQRYTGIDLHKYHDRISEHLHKVGL